MESYTKPVHHLFRLLPDCSLIPPALQQEDVCFLPEKENFSRLETVQSLATDGFLQNHIEGPERTSEVRHTTPLQWTQSEVPVSVRGRKGGSSGP